MSTSSDVNPSGHSAKVLQPRARPLNSHHEDYERRHETLSDAKLPTSGSDTPSRVSTPVPFDAPPSAQATQSARKQARAEQRRRKFPTVDYKARVSHFDPRSEHLDFRGFFVLFWVALAIVVITTMLRNLKETGYPFLLRQRQIFVANLLDLAMSDLAMTASSMLVVPLNVLYSNGPNWLAWRKGGVWVQSGFQAVWLLCWVNWPFIRNWEWTAQVFFTLHLLVLFMKLHSYAFYSGHLSETRRRLLDLDVPENASNNAAVIRYPSTNMPLHQMLADEDTAATNQSVKAQPLDQLREDLAFELTSPLGHVTYPQNRTFVNYVDFIFCPTLCYELEYPRNDNIDWLELVYKTMAVFGCICLLTIISEEFIMPVLDEAAINLQNTQDCVEEAFILAETISRLLFPFIITFLLVFLVIFEYITGAFAELTRFADRRFYSDWWNSGDWLEFSREWNIPVHNFFRRHVYTASRGVMSRPTATVLTFLVSAAAHELVMGCITKKLRGYGAVAMMLQMPIVMVQRSRWIRGRTLMNNVLFWCSMTLGLSLMCALYVLV